MFKSFVQKTAALFAKRAADLRFERVTEDKYDTYGIRQVLHKQAVDESAAWIKQYVHQSLLFGDRQPMFEYTAKNLRKFSGKDNLLFLEFGVFNGTSINLFSSLVEQTFYGFDTFEGMPEEWAGWGIDKGDFTLHGQLPPVNKNVTLVKGLVQDTLPGFLDQHKDKKIAFIHIDTDTYTPAKVVLQLCKNRLIPGSLILFDELHSYISWKLHEFKALQEELNENGYIFKAFSDRKQALLEIL